MVALLTKTELQALNIDTVEKALVFSALVLRSALVGDDDANTSNLAVSINVSAFDDLQGNLNLEVYIPYSAYQLNTKGGQLLDAVLEYPSNAPNLLLDLSLDSVPTTSGLTIPDYQDTVVNTIEKYLVYYAQILWASVVNKQDNTVSFTFISNQESPQILISVNLPLNLNQWLLGGNYLDSISTVVTEYVSPEPPSLDASSFTQSSNYYRSIDSPSLYSIEELWAFEKPAILDLVYFDVYHGDEESYFDFYFYLNGVEVPYEDFYDYGDDTYEIVFDTSSNPIIFMPGDILEIEVYGDLDPDQLDANIYVLELPAP